MDRVGLKYLPNERIYVDDAIDEKYPWKVVDAYEEDGVGIVCYYVLQCDTPKKMIANHIFKDNPKVQKVYMALRDWVSYNLPDDLAKGRRVKVYTRSDGETEA